MLPWRWPAIWPAHDEELQIARTVRSLLEAGCSRANSASSARVFVVAHNCSDRTTELAAEAGAVVVELNDHAQRGKGAALRAGFRQAQAEGANALLVVDADSLASSNLIAAVSAALAGGAEAVQCRYDLDLPTTAATVSRARLRALAFRGINVVRARGRAGLGLSAGIFGNGFAVTEATLKRVPFVADSICEDMEYHGLLVAAGIRVHWMDEAGVVAQIAPPGAAQARQEARWEGGRFRAALLSTRPLLAALFGGNLRALGSLFEFWSLPTARAVLLMLLGALLPVVWLRVYLAVCAGLLVLYVLQAALLGPAPLRDLAALLLAPFHLLWKAAITPLVLAHTRRHAAWSRTEREVPRP
jgi:cellulose synthase/poly-beta-1,6-N-acetylglucosamine synthase-like glycosyltransferase